MRYLLLAFTLVAPLAAQQPTTPPTPQAPKASKPSTQTSLRPPVADTGIFAPVDLPPGNEIRRVNGAPGPKYWQQRVDYSIKAILDTAANRLTGTMAIRYTNNSSDTLTRVWMQLDQNLFKPGSVGSLLNSGESRFGGGGFQGGFEIPWIVQSQTGMRAAKPLKPPTAVGLQQKLRTRVDDTMM